jgi:tetratricopeptide (TPR) repeat protein
MMKPRLRTNLVRIGFGLVLGACFCGGLLTSSVAVAEPDADVGVGEAERHFQQGVALYIEADYRGALVEFTRAYTLAPNGIVLFNVGETQYQLRDYAGALDTFQRYLIEAPADDGHRVLAQRNIKELSTRVGQLSVVTVPPGATVSINDRVVGQSPFRKPIVVGVGQLTVRAVLPGRPAIERPIEIAAEDEVLVTIEVPRLAVTRFEAAPPGNGLFAESSAPPSGGRSDMRTAGWVATGILAGGAVTFGLLAWNDSSDLRQARSVYPTTSDRINQLADRTKTLSIVADSLTAAALVVGGITLYSTITANAGAKSAQLTVGFGTLRLDGRF